MTILAQLWASVKAITVYQVIVACISAGTFLAPAYYLVKPLAVSAAGTAITRIMVAQGIDPQEFKSIPKKVEEQGQAQQRIESDLATLKAQQQQLLDELKKLLPPITTEPNQ